MNYKISTVAILVIMTCFVGVFGTADNARAWGWYGFSKLCVEDAFRGPEGWIVFRMQQATVITQCYNVNTHNLSQPGVGNGGDWSQEFTLPTEPTKDKGIVSVDGCIDLAIFDNHDLPEHIHTCYPYDNVNKEEVEGTAWVASFYVEWDLYNVDPVENPDAKPKNSGTDVCEWNGPFDEEERELEDGTIVTVLVPRHFYPFDCIETSEKKINYYSEE